MNASVPISWPKFCNNSLLGTSSQVKVIANSWHSRNIPHWNSFTAVGTAEIVAGPESQFLGRQEGKMRWKEHQHQQWGKDVERLLWPVFISWNNSPSSLCQELHFCCSFHQRHCLLGQGILVQQESAHVGGISWSGGHTCTKNWVAPSFFRPKENWNLKVKVFFHRKEGKTDAC